MAATTDFSPDKVNGEGSDFDDESSSEIRMGITIGKRPGETPQSLIDDDVIKMGGENGTGSAKIDRLNAKIQRDNERITRLERELKAVSRTRTDSSDKQT